VNGKQSAVSAMNAGDDVQLRGDEKEFLALLGYLYLRYGKWGKAVVIFEALQVLSPYEAYVFKALSFAYLQIEEHSKALDQAERFLSTVSRNSEREIGQFLRSKALWGLGETERARECLSGALDRRGSD
jgi:tetratricopeptide (TPR) repeat protein